MKARCQLDDLGGEIKQPLAEVRSGFLVSSL